MDRNKYLLKNTFFYTLANIVPKIISFIMVPLYTHIFTREEYGIIDIVFTLSILITPIIMMNVHESILRFSMDKNSKWNRILSSGLFIAILGSLLSILIIPIINRINILSEYSIYIYIYYVVSSFKPIITTFLRGTEKLPLFSFLSISETFVNASLNIYFLVYCKMGIIGYLLSNIFSQLMTIILGIVLGKLYKYIHLKEVSKNTIIDMIKYSGVLIPNSILWWLISSLDRFTLTYFLEAAANGIYAVSFKIPSIFSIIIDVFIQSWQLSVIKNVNDSDSDEYSYKIYKRFYQTVFIIGSILILFIKPIMNIYVSSEFYESWKYSPLIVFAFMIGSLSNFLAAYYVAFKKNFGNVVSAFAGAIVNLVLNIYTIPKIGIIGAAFSTVISYFIIYIYRAIDTRKFIKFNTINIKIIFNIILIIIQIMTLYINSKIGVFLSIVATSIILIYNKEIIVLLHKIIKNITIKKIKEISL